LTQSFFHQINRWLLLLFVFGATSAGVVTYLSNVRNSTVINPIWFSPFELFPVYWYGVIVLISIGVGFWAATVRPVVDENFSSKLIWRYIISICLGGIIGARLFDVIFLSPIAISQGVLATRDYLNNSAFLLDFSWGGLNVWGALFGGVIVLFWLSWRTKIARGPIFFKAIVGFLFGLSLVQWGHFINQELYGFPWDGLGSIYVEPIHRLEVYADVERFVPLFLLASFWYLAGALWLFFGRRWQRSAVGQFDGTMVGLIWFIIGRLVIELATPNSLFNWLPASILLTIILITVIRRKTV